jgi:hypothetical protein
VAHDLAGLCAVGEPGLEHHELGLSHYSSDSGGDKPDDGGKARCRANAYREAVLSVEKGWSLYYERFRLLLLFLGTVGNSK